MLQHPSPHDSDCICKKAIQNILFSMINLVVFFKLKCFTMLYNVNNEIYFNKLTKKNPFQVPSLNLELYLNCSGFGLN